MQTEITLAVTASFLFLDKKIMQKTFLITAPDRFSLYLYTYIYICMYVCVYIYMKEYV